MMTITVKDVPLQYDRMRHHKYISHIAQINVITKETRTSSQQLVTFTHTVQPPSKQKCKTQINNTIRIQQASPQIVAKLLGIKAHATTHTQRHSQATASEHNLNQQQ